MICAGVRLKGLWQSVLLALAVPYYRPILILELEHFCSKLFFAGFDKKAPLFICRKFFLLQTIAA